ncbi:hypothetical protein D3C77_234930 [compost metagenome]
MTLSPIPSPMGMPAKPEAMPVAKGLTVEASTPTPEPSSMIPAATMRSKPAAIMTGTMSAQKATVSSAMPKVEPPRAKRAISTGISSRSRPAKARTMAPTPASSAPLCMVTARKPPMMSTKSATSAAL